LVKRLIELGFLACVAASAAAQPPQQQKLSLIERAARLGTGQFVWEPKAASTGPLFLVIDLTRQRAMLYRDGVPIAASTISTGSKGRETPTGMFTILQKEVVHRSRTYDDAPMPYMQRLTAKGVAMHAGNLPGYPASHGCIRLPKVFAKLLFGVTELGTPVMITDDAELAEQARRAAEYQLALDDVARKTAELQADADRSLAEFDRAKAAHEKILRRHSAEVAKAKSEAASLLARSRR
jgi:L,D-transpeptidase catalytic domain